MLELLQLKNLRKGVIILGYDSQGCVHADVFRLKFGKEVGKRDVKSVAVPILWPEFTVSAKIVITSIGSFLPNMTKENPSGHQISVN
ncbi:unnamed protein product [Allacma fusca]|uniref:Uncharacterized protein n=1 Tax=Allacma fusca TaxID=39272 RepID=A0A8J2NZN2_9HEXA|nr:unnamed protein product [Allacma fusca]